jgi:LPS export ABC transporter protein LptC
MINALVDKKKIFRNICMIAFFFSVISCQNDLAFIQQMKKQDDGADVITQVESSLSQGGKLRAKLYAAKMLRFQDSIPRVEFPNKLHVDFYKDNHTIQSYLDAKKGSYFENQAKVLLEDSIVVIRKDGDTLKTDKLIWEQSRHSFYTDADVEIRQKTKTIFGKGFESDEQLQNFSIDTVTGVMLVESNKF